MSPLYHNKGHVDPYKIKQYAGKVLTASNNSEGGKKTLGDLNLIFETEWRQISPAAVLSSSEEQHLVKIRKK